MPHAKIDLKIHVTGLCLLELHGAPEEYEQLGPGTAERVVLHMVPTAGTHHPRHFPMLSYYLEDNLALVPGPDGTPVTPTPEGRGVVNLPLDNTDVKFFMPFDYEEKQSEFRWKPKPGMERSPQDPTEDKFMDWVLLARDIGFEEIDGDRTTCKVELPNGTWQCRSAFRNREITPNVPVLWKIESANRPPQAVATSLVLTLKNLRFAPRIKIRERDTRKELHNLVLCGCPDPEKEEKPYRRELSVCFSNAPGTVMSDPHSHVLAYQELAGKGRVRDLVRFDDVATSSGPPCDVVLKP